MGPIGVALNGVVFFNPFDRTPGMTPCGVWIAAADTPARTGSYHYHKYPACINTPVGRRRDRALAADRVRVRRIPGVWPLRGRPASWPRTRRSNPLNEFNLHTDEARGPHYHVTPGKFPHILGGYWGMVDAGNRPGRRGPPREE